MWQTNIPAIDIIKHWTKVPLGDIHGHLILGKPPKETTKLLLEFVKENSDFAYNSGSKMTGWKLYQFFCDNGSKNIILDNAEWIWRNMDAIGVMRGITEHKPITSAQWNMARTYSLKSKEGELVVFNRVGVSKALKTHKRYPGEIRFSNHVFVVAESIPKRASSYLNGLINSRMYPFIVEEGEKINDTMLCGQTG